MLICRASRHSRSSYGMVALPAYAIIATSLTDLDLSQRSAVFDRVASMDRIARRRAEEERRDMLFVPERRRSRRLKSAIRAERAQRAKQSIRIARRRAEEERRDMLFVPERRRSRRLPKRDPRR